MNISYTTIFDEELISKIPHLKNYPQMKPYIGSKWKNQNRKILLIGESHYIPGDELKDLENETHLTNWYHNTSDNFYQGLADYIDTRGVIHKADNPKLEGYSKALMIFYNLKREIQNTVIELKTESEIFPYFSVYNYFQRPHFKEGGSIKNARIDNEIAYKTLKSIISIIKPTDIIFVSSKAKDSFDFQFSIDGEKEIFGTIKVDSVPHASCRWWNTVSGRYGNRTGREKFIALISN
jgi:hypothetical protein